MKMVGMLFAAVREWARERNLDTADPTKQALKLGEEVGEIFEALAKGNDADLEDGIGDCMIVLTILAMQKGLDAEGCLESAYHEIKNRTGKMVNGVFVKEADLK